MRRVVLESGIDNEADWLLQALWVLLCWFAVCHEQGQFQQLMSSLCCASCAHEQGGDIVYSGEVCWVKVWLWVWFWLRLIETSGWVAGLRLEISLLSRLTTLSNFFPPPPPQSLLPQGFQLKNLLVLLMSYHCDSLGFIFMHVRWRM